MRTNENAEAQVNFEQLIESFKNQLDANIPELEKMGVAVPSGTLAYDETIRIPTRGAEQVTVELKWWGLEINMNDKFTKNVVDGTTATGAVAGLVAAAFGAAGAITGGAATVIGAGLAAIFAIKIAQMKIANNGKGVHWPITWAQWALIVAAVPGGPLAIVGAGSMLIHPIRNV